jgi:hypothetical protein
MCVCNYSFISVCCMHILSFVCVWPTLYPRVPIFCHLSHSYSSLPTGSYPPSQLICSPSTAAHSGPGQRTPASKNIEHVYCTLKSVIKICARYFSLGRGGGRRDLGGIRLGLRHLWTCVWHISIIWAAWLKLISYFACTRKFILNVI